MQFPDLTSTQVKILQFYIDFIREHGEAPKLREVGQAVGKATGTIGFHLGQLAESGYITRRRGNRNVMLTEKATA